MRIFSVAPSAAPYVLWATEHITALGVVGICLLSVLFALRSWRAAQPRVNAGRTPTYTMAALALHLTAIRFLTSYRTLVVGLGRRLGVPATFAARPRALVLGTVAIAAAIVLVFVAANWTANRLGGARHHSFS